MEYLINIITAIFNLFPSGILEAIGAIAIIYIAFKLITRIISRIIIAIAVAAFFFMLKAGFFNGIIETVASSL
ncbi:hypothetical protein [Viridibacillus arvi]|uniref:hypothetical protein n=1 Tax=Viridibacillus arvi TaxID=263475 RepID=UPI0034CDBE5B